MYVFFHDESVTSMACRFPVSLTDLLYFSSTQAGFGSPFQGIVGKAFAALADFDEKTSASFRQWEDPDAIRELFVAASFKFETVRRTIHSTVFDSIEQIYALIMSTPMVDTDTMSPTKADEIKKMLWEGLSNSGNVSPVFLVTASNIAVVSK